jgi:flagellar protein FliT
MNGHEIISLYENVAALTGRMLEAARDGDWARLVELESHCSCQVQVLRDDYPPALLAGEQRNRKVELINRILANDREIRVLTEPWMTRLSALINSAGAERKLSQAYGGTPRR